MSDKQDFVSGNIDYHKTLNPIAWDDSDNLRREVQLRLLEIARVFIKYLDIPNFEVVDIVLTGSMANYNYTKYSDFDIHVVTHYANLQSDDIAEAFYRAKKEIWNNEHDIKIRGHDAELYVEDSKTPPVSGGVYSILRDEWINKPDYNPPEVNNSAVNAKVKDLVRQIAHAIKDGDIDDIERIRTKIRNMRKSGLAKAGEFGVENLSFKILRNEGYLEKLHKAYIELQDKQLSLENHLNEAATSVLYHFSGIRAALNIIQSGEFHLSSVVGTRSEEQYAPPGHPYFLSLTRTRVGDYHRYVGTGGVLFVLDGNWFNRNHKVKPIDYWERGWQHSPGRSREAEDRVFSKTPTLPIDSIQEVHVLLKEQDKWRSPETRSLLLAAKKRGLKTYLYVDEGNWRLLNKSKSVSPGSASGVLAGQMPTRQLYHPERDYLEPWLELIYKNSKAELGSQAEKTRYNLVYYGSNYPNEDSGLGADLSNARKPDQGQSRKSAIKVIDYMMKNGFKTPLELRNYLVQKWDKIAEIDRARAKKESFTPLQIAIMEGGHSLEEGGWASTETQNTVITPKIIAEVVRIMQGFEKSYNAWQANNGLDTEIKIGNPKGSGTYYRRDLEQDPEREYGDIDIECFIHSREGVKSAQRITEYKMSITNYCLQSPDFTTENGTNLIMRTTAGPVQVDLLYTYHEHAAWSQVLSPEYRVKGVISTSLTSALAEVLNLSFSSQGIQVKIRNNQPVSFRQSKDTELRTVSLDPENWAKDIYSLYYYLSNGEQPTEFPTNLEAHSGHKGETRLSDIVLSIKALASALEDSNLLGHGALIGIPTKKDLVRSVATVYSNKLETAENSSKFDKAQTPAAVEKAKKTKLMLAKYRNEITKLLLN